MYATKQGKCKCPVLYNSQCAWLTACSIGGGTDPPMEKEFIETQAIPVLAEELDISKRQVETGRGVRVHKTVTEREQTVDRPLLLEHVEVTRVPLGKVVDTAPPIRYVGDTTIIPVLEEQLVMEKRLVLKEEIHIRKSQTTVRDPQRVILREEHARVEKFGDAMETQRADLPPAPAGGSVLDKVFPPAQRRNQK